jgi:methionyl aminopeptidase
MITIKSPREVETMRAAGSVLAATLQKVATRVEPGVSTQDLDVLAEDFIRSHDGAKPSFKGLYGFPKSLCTSINNEIVHGIPSKGRVLAEGDILSVDCGVFLNGMHADSAITVPVGEVSAEAQRLMDTTKASLDAGIQAAVLDNHVGDIGHAVQAVAEAAGYSVVRDLVGHGIGAKFHEEPQVPNFGQTKRGVRLAKGMTIAIEPMVNIGGRETRTMDDNWTIVTADGSLSAHFEHTIVIEPDGPRILTLLD